MNIFRVIGSSIALCTVMLCKTQGTSADNKVDPPKPSPAAVGKPLPPNPYNITVSNKIKKLID